MSAELVCCINQLLRVELVIDSPAPKYIDLNEPLGFEPKYTIQDGIEELIDAIKNHVFDNIDVNPNFFGNYEIDYPIQ